MIQSGGWNRLRTMDAFQINVSKKEVVIPEEIRPQLRAVASGVVNMAHETSRK
jgi:hypothetical protein